MKKKKFSIMLSIATLCLCVAVLAFGVYAAKKASLTTTGSINFEAHNCEVRVLGSVSGAVDNTGAEKTVDKLKDTETDSDGNELGKLITGDVTWAVGDLYFDDLNCSNDEIATPIVFTFVMTNESDYPVTAEFDLSEDFYVEVLDSSIFSSVYSGPQTKLSTSLTFTKENESDFLSNSQNICLLDKNQTVTATISIVPVDDSDFANLDLNNIKILFEKANVVESTNLQDLTYTLNTSTNTASVKFPVDTSTISSLTIPTAISVDNSSYLVTGIDGIDGDEEYVEYLSQFLDLYIDTENDYSIEEVEAKLKENGTEGSLNKSLKSLTIPNSVNRVDAGAFAGCLNLSSLNIKSKNCCLEEFTFALSTSLKSFVWEGSILIMCYEEFVGAGLTNLSLQSNRALIIGDYTFAYCSLQTCTLKGGECLNLVIGGTAGAQFCLNTSLTNIVLEGNRITLGDAAFAGCSSLETVSFIGEVEYLRIGGSCFNLCSSLSSLNFTNVKSFSADGTSGACFADTLITSLTLPKDTTFGPYCNDPFYESNITTITYLGTKDEWNAIVSVDFRGSEGFVYANVTKVICTDGTIDISKE